MTPTSQGYREVWDATFYAARDRGDSIVDAAQKATREAQEWEEKRNDNDTASKPA